MLVTSATLLQRMRSQNVSGGVFTLSSGSQAHARLTLFTEVLLLPREATKTMTALNVTVPSTTAVTTSRNRGTLTSQE